MLEVDQSSIVNDCHGNAADTMNRDNNKHVEVMPIVFASHIQIT